MKKMEPLFEVSKISLLEMSDMPNTWCDDDYLMLLEMLEIDDFENLSGSDLFDLTVMALQDLTPAAAADAVLACKLKKRITSGARQEIVQDFLDERKPWEEAADITLHSIIFSAAVLLRKALPKKFLKPIMTKVTLTVTGLNPEAEDLLSHPLEAPFVARILADGMEEKCILKRLFAEQLASHYFPEAYGIIWRTDVERLNSNDTVSAELTIYSSNHWLKAMHDLSDYRSNAHNDKKQKEDEHGK